MTADGRPPAAMEAEAIELASPPCEAATADDVYMGFAPREELLALCARLLHLAADGGPHGRERSRLLAQAIDLLGGTPAEAGAPNQPGSLVPAAAALTRQLERALPRVRDDRVHALLRAVLQLQRAGDGLLPPPGARD